MSCSGTGFRKCSFSRPRHTTATRFAASSKSKVLRDRLARHVQMLAKLAERLPVGRVQKVQQAPAIGVGERLELPCPCPAWRDDMQVNACMSA